VLRGVHGLRTRLAAVDHPTSLAARAAAAGDPRDRLRAISALRDELDQLEVEVVRLAIGAGSSWSEVAAALGVTKQSAHRRHAKRITEPPSAPRRGHEVTERLVVTAQARRAVRAARAAARALEHVEVDPGHLLLGVMADPDSSAATALSAIGVPFEAARDAVGRLGLPATPAGSPENRPIPISSAARTALEQSLREAQRLGHGHLGVEHILLALLRDEHGGAVRVLDDIGIPPADLERCLGKVLKEAPFAPR
jgi:hypothetical protein